MNNKDIKPCFKGDATKETGGKIIKYLESIGGKNTRCFNGMSGILPFYYISDEDGIIYCSDGLPLGHTLCELPSIIGYEAPFDMFGGIIEKGAIARKSDQPYVYRLESHLEVLPLIVKYLPSEIVETWKPVWSELEPVVQKPHPLPTLENKPNASMVGMPESEYKELKRKADIYDSFMKYKEEKERPF